MEQHVQKEIEEDLKYLSEKERNELLAIDDPRITYSAPVTAWFLTFFFNKREKKHNQKRIIELRTKMQLAKLGIDPKNNKEEAIKIKEEEIRKFDARHTK